MITFEIRDSELMISLASRAAKLGISNMGLRIRVIGGDLRKIHSPRVTWLRLSERGCIFVETIN